MNRLMTAGLMLLACSGGATEAMAGTLQGQVSFVLSDSKASLPDYTDTVVFFRPDVPARVEPLSKDVTLTMVGKSFAPHVLTVTVGTKVRFPNSDPIFHNAFSPSAPNAFDLGLYDTGDGKSQVFARPGLVHVYCNVHHDMFAYILVLDTPYFTSVGEDGSFTLKGLPAVAGEITIWNPRTEIWRQRIVAGAVTPMTVQLPVVYNGVPDHLNKDGKAYFKHRMPGG